MKPLFAIMRQDFAKKSFPQYGDLHALPVPAAHVVGWVAIVETRSDGEIDCLVSEIGRSPTNDAAYDASVVSASTLATTNFRNLVILSMALMVSLLSFSGRSLFYLNCSWHN